MATEGERLIKLETQMENLKDIVDKGFKESKESQEALSKIISDFIEKSENRFASKWVEKAVWGVASLIITGFVTAVLALVFKTGN